MDTSCVSRWIAACALFVLGCGGTPLDAGADLPTARVEEESAPLTIIGPIFPPPRPACGLHIVVPPGRYDFDAGSTSGWQVSGVFDGDAEHARATTSARVEARRTHSSIGNGSARVGDGLLVQAGDDPQSLEATKTFKSKLGRRVVYLTTQL